MLDRERGRGSMAASMKFMIFMCIFTASASIQLVLGQSTKCFPQSTAFINDLQLQCPQTISPSSPIEIDGETLDRALSSKPAHLYTVVLFYASWCPFSHGVRANFDVLSSMFPQIRHLAVEQSSTMPSVFSRYGIHSLPTILIVNQTARMWYLGQKDLSSLVLFYKRTTGLEPVQYMTGDQSGTSEAGHPWSEPSLKEALRREPYLGFSVLFLCLRAFLYFYPELLSRLTFLWVSYIPHPSLDILRESSQLLGRILHLIDVKRGWSKLKQCKTRNFHKSAKSARVWASSLTSVSLGETSSGRNPSSLGLE